MTDAIIDGLARERAIAGLISNHVEEFEELRKKHLERLKITYKELGE